MKWMPAAVETGRRLRSIVSRTFGDNVVLSARCREVQLLSRFKEGVIGEWVYVWERTKCRWGPCKWWDGQKWQAEERIKSENLG